MTSRSRLVPVLVTMSLAAAGLAACGGSSDPVMSTASGPSEIVAQVGGRPITRSMLSHWMATLVGGDYNENLGGIAPKGLVSDPPDYVACAGAIETMGPPQQAETPTAAHAELDERCHALYQAAKKQALSYLIVGLGNEVAAAEHKVVVTPQEVHKHYEETKRREFSSEAAFQGLLTRRRWSLSDYMYLIRRDTLMAKLNAWREQAARRAVKGGSAEAVQRTALELYAAEAKRLPSITSCRAGYLVPECKQYKGPVPQPGISTDAVLEGIVASRKT